MWLLVHIICYTLILLAVHHVFSYWKRRRFPQEKTVLYWDFFKQLIRRELQYVKAINADYRRFRSQPFVGIYCRLKPCLLVRDLSFANSIMKTAGAHHFTNTKWDYSRNYRKYNLLEKLSPIFCKNQLEGMLPHIEKVGNNLLNHLNDRWRQDDKVIEVDAQYLISTFVINVLANLIYGSEIDHFKQTDNVFKQYVNEKLRNTRAYNFFLRQNSSITLREMLNENVQQREQSGLIRKDILQMLLKLRNGDNIEYNEKFTWCLKKDYGIKEKFLSLSKLTRIVEHLFDMGYESMAVTATFTLYEILKDDDIRQKIMQELEAFELTKTNCNTCVNYENLQNLKFMDLCIQETTRKYPSVPLIERQCCKDFKLPGTKLTMRDGDTMIIPLMAIQHDEKYYVNPLSYKPQRFVEDKSGEKAEVFIGFGFGAQICVAQHLIKLVIKLILVKLFLNYQLESTDSGSLKVDYKRLACIRAKKGFKIKLKKLLQK
uniref:Cytochrome P450 n=1 Tax=Glossina pallidipes TaxID=7398 RepID=A0A1A9ZFJ8_GLOPL